MIETLCNGLRHPRPCYTEDKRQELIETAQSVRDELRQEYPDPNHDDMVYCGWRFDNDDDLIATLESCIDQKNLFANGNEWAVRDALLNCMSRDYWYRFEKDWGCEYGGDDFADDVEA